MNIGRIFDIQRFSVHDGPGIRTTVFLKGCPLRCLWCHNPESLSRKKQISFLPSKCIFCGECVRVCNVAAHILKDDEHNYNRDLCVACGRCVEACHPKALELIGRDVSPAEVLEEVLRDKPFYEHSGGGMTLSGGEPLMQAEFSAELLALAKAEGLHCCIETCGHVPWDTFENIRENVDLFMFDIKDTDPEKHKEFTGVDTELIQANLRKLYDTGASILLRLPTVPGCNDRKDHFEAIAKLVKDMPNLLGVEIMPYHRLGTGKRPRLGIKDELPIFDPETPDSFTVASWVTTLRELGVNVINEDPTKK
jgi:pyruvate formate lyase activating enzyme